MLELPLRLTQVPFRYRDVGEVEGRSSESEAVAQLEDDFTDLLQARSRLVMLATNEVYVSPDGECVRDEFSLADFTRSGEGLLTS